MTAAVELRGVRKSFGATPVLRGIDLTVRPGEVVAVIGPSGSGKSTLLRVLNHLEPLDAGTVHVAGELIGYKLRGGELHALPDREVREQRSRIGFVFQQFNLFGHLTVLDNVTLAPRTAQHRPRAEVEAEARQLLERVGIGGFADAYPRRLSGGQQQRVAIARAPALRPPVILFDEPTSALDWVRVPKVDEIAALVPRAIRDRGTLVVTGSSGTAPPLRFYATDDKTVVGSEVDFAQLVADTLGLELEIQVADWSNNVVRVDSGEVGVFISNVTVTEERKEKYDFATYRQDNVALEVPADGGLEYRDRTSLAGKRIGVGTGTNQEQLLVKWNEQNRAEGLDPIDVAYFQQTSDYYLAPASGRLDGYIGPNPTAIHHSATTKESKIVATFSGAGEQLQHVIADGSYRKVIDRWSPRTEALTDSRINPPSLPKQK
ncbi:ATP-binding cassette domain-containing protein [Nocardia jiangsuensis]|uniref:ATP-binding cassette domain-containing protein n=1 Tax=Nocardia jiangsuensis TaxID=1691563 RepID=A0ABV8E0P7_9NOCA